MCTWHPTGLDWSSGWDPPHKRALAASRQQQAAIPNQDFSIKISSTASATLPSYLWGSFKPIDWHWQISLSYMLNSILFYSCLKKEALLNSTGRMAIAHRSGHCQKILVPRVNHWELIIFLAPKGFRGGETSQPRKPFVPQGSSLALPVKVFFKAILNSACLAVLAIFTG